MDISDQEMNEAVDRFQDEVEKNGYAGTAVKEGYLFMFRTDILRRLLLVASHSDTFNIGMKDGNGSIKTVKVPRDRLQAELDVDPTAKEIMLLVSHEPVLN